MRRRVGELAGPGATRPREAAPVEDQLDGERSRDPGRSVEIPRLFSSKGEVALYDLTIDRAEKNNLAAQHPDIVKNLSAKLEAWLTTLPKDDVKTADEDEQRPLGFGEWVGGASSTKREHAG